MKLSDILEPADRPAAYFMQQTAQLRARVDALEAALYRALPYVEDHEESPIYKPGAVAAAVAQIREALQEPNP